MTKNNIQAPTKYSRNEFYAPFYKMRSAMGDVFNDFFSNFDDSLPVSYMQDLVMPKSDIIEDKDQYKLLMDMPGVEEKDIDISIDKGVLKITGKKERFQETKDDTIHSMEREYGNFSKTLQLPNNISIDDIKAHFKNGVLKVIIPKTEESKRETKKIVVNSG